MKLGALLIAIAAVALLLVFIFDYSGVRVGDFIVSWKGMLFSAIVATAYYTVRKLFA